MASQAGPVVVVLGYQADVCRAALGDRPVTTVYNADWAQGQSSSVKAGLAALPVNIGAALFLLADQPGVTPAVVDALIARHRSTLAPVVWPEYEGRRGNPVLFDRVAFPDLLRLSGDIGGRPVLHAYADRAERVAVADPGILSDIDTPGDYEQATGQNPL
jgi:molybdenum cofactor cytidylyltransferase